MVEKLIGLEIVLCASLAACLFLVPNMTTRILGWAPAQGSLWPRVAAALLAGLAFASFADVAGWTKSDNRIGLGLAGYVAVNLALGFVFFSMALTGPAMPTRRGKWIAITLGLGLVVMALVQMAHI